VPPKTGGIKTKTPPFSLTNIKYSTVGIDIGQDYLRLVRVVETAGGKLEIIARRRFAVPPKARLNSPEFAAFLKSSLNAICGSAKRTDLWVNMSTASIDVHHVRIPKVAKKQLSNVVYWTAKKETPFDEKEMVFDFETQGEVIEQGIHKLSVMIYTAPRKEIEDLTALFSGIGRPLTGISILPFSVQNLFRSAWIPAIEGSVANIFIGNDFSHIDVYSAGNLVMTRGIKSGLSSMAEALMNRLSELKQDPAARMLTIEQCRIIIQSLSPDAPPLQKTDAGVNLRKEDIFEMIQPALDRLLRQVERTINHYATMMPGERIVRIYVSGAMSDYRPIFEYFGTQLGIQSAVLNPLIEQEYTACPDVDDTGRISEQVAFGPALGLALSDCDHTPNLMFTFRDKDEQARIKRINRAVFTCFLAVILVCAVAFIYQNQVISQKKAEIAVIEAELSRLGSPIDRNQLIQLVAKVKQRNENSRAYADRYLGMVLISELAALTPKDIRFTDLKITLGPPTVAASDKKDAAKARVEEITVEGLILGERQMFETSLAGYAMSLEASPLFRQVAIQKNIVEPYLKGEALHFILNIKVEEQIHG
jgi:Tfp pilus assembly PilM family ATPase